MTNELMTSIENLIKSMDESNILFYTDASTIKRQLVTEGGVQTITYQMEQELIYDGRYMAITIPMKTVIRIKGDNENDRPLSKYIDQLIALYNKQFKSDFDIEHHAHPIVLRHIKVQAHTLKDAQVVKDRFNFPESKKRLTDGIKVHVSEADTTATTKIVNAIDYNFNTLAENRLNLKTTKLLKSKSVESIKNIATLHRLLGIRII